MTNEELSAISGLPAEARKFTQIIMEWMLPSRVRKQADAVKYAIEQIMPAAASQALKIKSFMFDKDGVRIEGEQSEKPLNLSQRAQLRIEAEDERQQTNIESVLHHGFRETFALPQGQTHEDRPNEDWMARFFSIVPDISDMEMQMLWGRILSGEINSPGSYRLRTLDLLKNISSKEALIFSKFARLTFNYRFIFFDEAKLKDFDIIYDDILNMEAIGLVQRNLFLVAGEADRKKGRLEIRYNGRVFAMNISRDKSFPDMSCICLTPSGTELASLTRERYKEYYELLHEFYKVRGYQPMDYSSSTMSAPWAPLERKKDHHVWG